MLEAVPNVSEGRSAGVLREIGDAFEGHASLLDVHSDPDHHRSVFTLAGHEEDLVDALLAGVARAVALIDLRLHSGVHPRVGVVDVLPVVPLRPRDMSAAARTARVVAARVGDELSLPVFFYGAVGEGRVPAFFRRGGLESLIERVENGELVPDAGPHELDPRAGAILVGARPPLVAYNIELDTTDVGVAREVAASVRESGGGMPGVQAIGLFLPTTGRVQVSMNVLDIERAPLHEVVARVSREAANRGVAIRDGELVGLVPASVFTAARKAGAEIPGVDETRVLERLLASRLGP